MHKSKVSHVQSLLCQLQQRISEQYPVTMSSQSVVAEVVSNTRSNIVKPQDVPDSESDTDVESTTTTTMTTKADVAKPRVVREKRAKPKERASIDHLESYLELLYEDDVDEIARGTRLLAQLSKDRSSLESLCSNDTAIGALTRVLNENRKKNAELVANVLDVFRAISRYPTLHPILLSSKIGDTTMKIIDLECKRYEMHRDRYH